MEIWLELCSKFKPYYDNQYPWQRISGAQATATAIQNPFTFYYVNNNDWSSSHSYQFWNKNFTAAASVNNTETLKTIYSPSPSGFVEPKTAAFTGFTSTGGNSTNSSQFNVSGIWNRGWNFYTNGWKTGSTIFFDALGYRDTYNGGTGAVVTVGVGGVFWSAGASSTSNGRSLYSYSSFVTPQDSGVRSYGFSIKTVKE